MIRLKYGNTNTYFVPGAGGGLLFDTDRAGTLPAFYKAIKQSGVALKDVRYVLASHYHPDHMGLISELMQKGVKLLAADVQKDFLHSSDGILARDGIPYSPIDETRATVISFEESRSFLAGIGIGGEIVHTPSHSADSVCLILDSGDLLAGDLEPYEYIGGYENNDALRRDWDRVFSFRPRRIYFAHRPEKIIE